jgi:uncharacterized protein YfcZ (UPF0381/DUF406 family)
MTQKEIKKDLENLRQIAEMKQKQVDELLKKKWKIESDLAEISYEMSEINNEILLKRMLFDFIATKELILKEK